MKRAVALGFFDGVHKGHGALLRRCVEVSREKRLSPCVMTYSRHPKEVVSGESVELINTTDERISIISDLYGIEDIVVKEFTHEYAALSCEDFFRDIIISELSSDYVIAGFDFTFGRFGKGDAKKLKKLCEEYGVGCEIVEEVRVSGETVSSTRIRELLELGEVERANELLGHLHFTESMVLEGKKLGRELNFPTANQIFSKGIKTPRFGVYKTRITVDGKEYTGVTNVGRRPTVDRCGDTTVETHIPGFSGDLYGKVVRTEFVRFIRDEMRFSSLSELCAQVEKDIEKVKTGN